MKTILLEPKSFAPDHHETCVYFADLMSTYHQQHIAHSVTTLLSSLPPRPKGVRPLISE